MEEDKNLQPSNVTEEVLQRRKLFIDQFTKNIKDCGAAGGGIGVSLQDFLLDKIVRFSLDVDRLYIMHGQAAVSLSSLSADVKMIQKQYELIMQLIRSLNAKPKRTRRVKRKGIKKKRRAKTHLRPT